MDEKGTPLSPNSIADTWNNAKFVLPHGGSANLEMVIQHYLDVNGQVNGNHNEDLILDTFIYNVEFQYIIIKPYVVDVIAQIS